MLLAWSRYSAHIDALLPSEWTLKLPELQAYFRAVPRVLQTPCDFQLPQLSPLNAISSPITIKRHRREEHSTREADNTPVDASAVWRFLRERTLCNPSVPALRRVDDAICCKRCKLPRYCCACQSRRQRETVSALPCISVARPVCPEGYVPRRTMRNSLTTLETRSSSNDLPAGETRSFLLT